MKIPTWPSAALSIVLVALVFPPRWAGAAPPALKDGGTTIDLKTQLEMGLKARRPVDFAYLAQIVKLVDEGRLPRSLVTSTFAWARVLPNHQLQYFQFALADRAKRLNIPLPNPANQAVGFMGIHNR